MTDSYLYNLFTETLVENRNMLNEEERIWIQDFINQPYNLMGEINDLLVQYLNNFSFHDIPKFIYDLTLKVKTILPLMGHTFSKQHLVLIQFLMQSLLQSGVIVLYPMENTEIANDIVITCIDLLEVGIGNPPVIVKEPRGWFNQLFCWFV